MFQEFQYQSIPWFLALEAKRYQVPWNVDLVQPKQPLFFCHQNQKRKLRGVDVFFFHLSIEKVSHPHLFREENLHGLFVRFQETSFLSLQCLWDIFENRWRECVFLSTKNPLLLELEKKE